MKREGYRFAIHWIARNDETLENDPDAIREQISVLLVADLFGKDPVEVASAVIRARQSPPDKGGAYGR